MENHINISVIIPTRNEAKAIGGTIAQFIPFLERYKLEIIVSDAGSTDATEAVVNEYIQQYPNQIRFVQKLGKQNIAIGRNQGGWKATGDILFHTDADMRLTNPELFFETILQRFSDVKISAATAPLQIYSEERTTADIIFHWLMNSAIRVSIPFRLCLAKGECQIVRRTAFDQIGGYDERLVAGEDCNLFYRLQQTGRVLYLSNLEVQHSPRRFRQLGYWKVTVHYFMEGVTRLFLRRSYAREWRVVR
jgi:glycosyltransferase involved in cell wall biosynthesis